MESRNWHESFLESVTGDLEPFHEMEMIDDTDIRALFRGHLKAIYLHYHQIRGEPTGKLQDYLTALDLSNEFLNKKAASLFGYFGLLPIASAYIACKLVGKKYEFSNEIRRPIRIARQNSVIERGKKIFPQVTCDAERDFCLLLKKYISFFYASGEFKHSFTQHSINLGMILPNLGTIIERRLKNINDRVERYDQLTSNYNDSTNKLPSSNTHTVLSHLLTCDNMSNSNNVFIDEEQAAEISTSTSTESSDNEYQSPTLLCRRRSN